MKHRKTRLLTTAAALILAASTASAHDTWFGPLPGPPGQAVRLSLGTGNRFPVSDQGVDDQHFVLRGCRNAEGSVLALGEPRHGDKFSDYATRALDAASLSCWMQLKPFDIELTPDRVEVYFKEIRPSDAVRQAWAALRQRGLPFRERYVKSARIDGPQASPLPTGTLMDVLRVAPTAALRVGDVATFEVLRDGLPLAHLPVELISEKSAIGLWYRTDEQGRVHARLPLPGRWLLRGTELRISAEHDAHFVSHFVSYAFGVVP